MGLVQGGSAGGSGVSGPAEPPRFRRTWWLGVVMAVWTTAMAVMIGAASGTHGLLTAAPWLSMMAALSATLVGSRDLARLAMRLMRRD